MQCINTESGTEMILLSPSDLVAFTQCSHRTALDLRLCQGDKSLKKAADDTSMKLVADHGTAHETSHLARLRDQGLRVVEISSTLTDDERIAATLDAMRDGAEVIYQAVLRNDQWRGYADFLYRVPGESDLGDYHYEVADTKLARSNRAKFLLQLCLYAELVGEAQGRLPSSIHVELGNGHTESLSTTAYFDAYLYAKQRAESQVATQPATRPEPCNLCSLCHWREHCAAQWLQEDHLQRVAGIRRDQIIKLHAHGIHTVARLAQLDTLPVAVKGIGQEVLCRLQHQAALQLRAERGEIPLPFEYRVAQPDKESGFSLMPAPHVADLYFDMEGYPFERSIIPGIEDTNDADPDSQSGSPAGLEYLFGVGYYKTGEFTFKAFWAHDRVEEKAAFEAFMDFITSWFKQHPNAHIYHYASYEQTAIKRLAAQYGTREAERDQLLRDRRLVDLYRVVVSGLTLSTESYSIKKVERYYRGARQGEVVNAGESIVMYEAWRNQLPSPERDQLLRDIEAYNRDDVESTAQLHGWLEKIRPGGAPRRAARLADDATTPAFVDQVLASALEQLDQWQSQNAATPDAAQLAELLGGVLGFYRRNKLPLWWRMYARKEASIEELLDDPDVLAGLTRLGEAEPIKRSLRYRYEIPEQEFAHVLREKISFRSLDEIGTPAINNVEGDLDNGWISFTRGANKDAPPYVLSIVLNEEISDGPLQESIYRYVDALCNDRADRTALTRLLRRDGPQVYSHVRGTPLVSEPDIAQISGLIARLDNSYLAIQGPPGTGKTTTAAAAITQLIAAGNQVAICSNGHKAINNLLGRAFSQCLAQGIACTALKVGNPDGLPRGIDCADGSAAADACTTTLLGGTAWVFCREAHHERWDYLFIDEASQFSLAHLIAIGAAGRNLVLLGDQMQLPQPTPGTHPGKSGLSALDFLMQGHDTVPPSEGIFLNRSYRMHPAICQPISRAIYQDRLSSDAPCATQRLILGPDADPALQPNGIVHVEVQHEGCGRHSDAEVQRIDALYHSLLGQQWQDRDGRLSPLTASDILIVAPYNAQVQCLKQKLGDDAQVGSVDKFQGLEAPVVIVSMCASDASSAPRGLNFLLNRNRLTVAVSRARCLALIVASPTLSLATADTPEQLSRLSFYCALTK